MSGNDFILSNDSIKNNLNLIKDINNIKDLINCITTINLEDIDNNIIEKIEKISKEHENQIPYSLISEYMYNAEGNYTLDLIQNNISSIIKSMDKESIELKFILKIKEHILLCDSQIRLMQRFKKDREVREFELKNEFINNIKSTTEEMEGNFRNTAEKLEKELETKIITHIIGLIAIFTTLAFLLFGGISFLSDLLKAFESTEELKILFIVSVWGLAFSNIFYLFIYFIFCMIGKDSTKIKNLKCIQNKSNLILGVIAFICFSITYRIKIINFIKCIYEVFN